MEDTMTRDEFCNQLAVLITGYIENPRIYGDNPQIRVEPDTRTVSVVNNADFLQEIADNDEAVEEAAAADDDTSEDATDAQVRRNPDFYTLTSYISTHDGKSSVDTRALHRLADEYFGKAK